MSGRGWVGWLVRETGTETDRDREGDGERERQMDRDNESMTDRAATPKQADLQVQTCTQKVGLWTV